MVPEGTLHAESDVALETDELGKHLPRALGGWLAHQSSALVKQLLLHIRTAFKVYLGLNLHFGFT